MTHANGSTPHDSDVLVRLEGVTFLPASDSGSNSSTSARIVPRGAVTYSPATGRIVEVTDGVSASNGSAQPDHHRLVVVAADGYMLLPGLYNAGIVLDGEGGKPGVLNGTHSNGSFYEPTPDAGEVLELALRTGTTTAVVSTTAARLPDATLSPRVVLASKQHQAAANGSASEDAAPFATGHAAERPANVWVPLQIAAAAAVGAGPAGMAALVRRATHGARLAVGEPADLLLVRAGQSSSAVATGNGAAAAEHAAWRQLARVLASPPTLGTSLLDAVVLNGRTAVHAAESPAARAWAAATLGGYYEADGWAAGSGAQPAAATAASVAAAANESGFDTIEEAIEAFRRGEFVVAVDNEDRENEGDLLLPAEDATPDKIAFMIRYT
ncbi:hypothetical protein HK405_004800, partial [Cladochytrium tenue]